MDGTPMTARKRAAARPLRPPRLRLSLPSLSAPPSTRSHRSRLARAGENAKAHAVQKGFPVDPCSSTSQTAACTWNPLKCCLLYGKTNGLYPMLMLPLWLARTELLVNPLQRLLKSSTAHSLVHNAALLINLFQFQHYTVQRM